MIKRPLNSRFSDAVREGRKITTIRDNPWPVGKQVMLYNWTGAAYRSKQKDVAAVTVLATSPVTISRVGDAMTYAIKYEWPIGPLWKTEGFDSQEDMDSWFRAKTKPGHAIEKTLMRFMANALSDARPTNIRTRLRRKRAFAEATEYDALRTLTEFL